MAQSGRTKRALGLVAWLVGATIAAPAATEPLASTGWLATPPPAPKVAPVMTPADRRRPAEPPRLRPPSRERLDAAGLVAPDIAGIAATLWAASDTETLTAALARMQSPRLPALQSLLERLLLISATPPALGQARDGAFLLARIEALLGWGMVDPALALAETANAATPDLALRWLEAGLLAGQAQQVCEALGRARLDRLPSAEAVFCQARLGDWSGAEARLSATEIDPAMAALLRLFLELDDAETTAPPLPSPLTPLAFRLREAVGAPLDTRPLPPAFAVADLRDVAGFKAQVEAAERLGRLGALSANRWIGIVNAGRPAASGGVWDRIAALQRFDTALENTPDDAIGEPLRTARQAMVEAGLEGLFAELYAARLMLSIAEDAALPPAVFETALLSASYERAAARPPEGALPAFLAALAQGEPGRVTAPNAMAATIQAGWTAPLGIKHRNMLAENRQGEVLLEASRLLADGVEADPRGLTTGLALMRAMGFEQTARRASLELMLLGQTP